MQYTYKIVATVINQAFFGQNRQILFLLILSMFFVVHAFVLLHQSVYS